MHFFFFSLLAAAGTYFSLSFKATTSAFGKLRHLELSTPMSVRLRSFPSSYSDQLYANSNYEVETKKGEAVLHAGLKESVRRVIKHWNYADGDIIVRSLRGGITNLLYTLTPMEMEEKTVIVRIYGEGTSLFVDRTQENTVFSSLSDRGISPKFYGTFNNGRVEGYCDARTLTADEMKDSLIYPRTSMAIARLHTQNILDINHDVSLWTKLDSFFDLAESSMISAHLQGKSSRVMSGDLSLAEMRDQSMILRKSIDETKTKLADKHRSVETKSEKMKAFGAIFGYEVVLCHNDLLSGNILLLNNVTDNFSEAVRKIVTQYSVEEKHNGLLTPEESSSSFPASKNTHLNEECSEEGGIINAYLTNSDVLQKEVNMNTEGVTLIDFEYAAYNYRAWDIANHFNEFAGFDFNIKKDFPNMDRRVEFLSHYVIGASKYDVSASGIQLSEIINDAEDFRDFIVGLEVRQIKIPKSALVF